MKADYPLAPFLDAPRGIFASLIIFGAAACVGQIIFMLIHSEFWDPHDWTGFSFYFSGVRGSVFKNQKLHRACHEL